MKYYLIAGEASGDLHASRIIEELLKEDKNAEFRFLGGDLMKSKAGTLTRHYKQMAFMGLWEVIKNIDKVKDNFKLCKSDILAWKPDVVILIDYPGFNLKIAQFAKKNNIKVVYYISPKVWVWKKSRIKTIKKNVDRMYVILPFEVDFYKNFNYDVKYLGNPSVDTIDEEMDKRFDFSLFKNIHNLSDKPVIALLPGSRVQEIVKIMPTMMNVAGQFPDYQFVVAGVSSVDKNVYENTLKGLDLKIIFDDTFNLLKISKAAVVTSGTATLETALFNVPQVVCYKTSKFTYAIGKTFISIDYFSLVNILMKKQVVVELLQKNLEVDIVSELNNILFDDNYRYKMLEDYKQLSNMLGKSGASKRIANDLVSFLNK